MAAVEPHLPAPPVIYPAVVIEPSHGWVSLRLKELWAYRELLGFLAWRDVKVRYKQAALGVAWAIIQPLMQMVIFTIFFGRLANIDSGGIPYPIFAYAGLLPWSFFAHGMTESSNSLVGSANLIKKVYFPRLIIPLAAILSGAIDFLLAFALLILLMVHYKVVPAATSPAILPLFLLVIAVSTGGSLWLAALNVQYRDVRYVVPFLVQMWLFVTPIIYPSSAVTARLAKAGLPGWVYGLNPMAGVVEGFRWAIFARGPFPAALIETSVAVTAVLMVTGAMYFRRMEKNFADLV